MVIGTAIPRHPIEYHQSSTTHKAYFAEPLHGHLSPISVASSASMLVSCMAVMSNVELRQRETPDLRVGSGLRVDGVISSLRWVALIRGVSASFSRLGIRLGETCLLGKLDQSFEVPAVLDTDRVAPDRLECLRDR